MKPVSLINRLVLPLCIMLLFYSCQENGEKIPYDKQRAMRYVVAYDSLVGYVNSFTTERKRLYGMVKDSMYFKQSFNMPAGEMFNRDAIIALLNAPGMENVRIYLGKKKNGEVVFVLLPVDKNNNDIKVNLVDADRVGAISVPGVSSANAAPPPGAQGLEDGQRCPTVCGVNDDLILE
jgi:hypothetical protein